MKIDEIKSKIGCTMVSKNRKGNYVARESYFYRSGRSEDKLAEKIKTAFPNAEIVDKWDQWTPFRGGAPVAKQSHFGVEFKLL